MKLQQKTIEKLRQLINEDTEYRSGPNLISFFHSLGFSDSYGKGFPSRWIYTEDKLKTINGTKRLEQCIKNLFSPVNFIERFESLDNFIADFNQYLAFDGYKIVRHMKEIIIKPANESDIPIENIITESEFINKEFKNISLEKLGLESPLNNLLKHRIEEIRKCLNNKSSLAVVFLCGSTLEGILLGVALVNPKKYNESKASPKNKEGKSLQFHEWSLANFIDVSHSLGFLGEDVKKFSHALRDFRNYIHPYQQMASNFNPDEHTAKICWQVLQAAIDQLSKKS